MSAVFKYRWVAVPVLVTSATIVTAALIGDRSAVDYGGGLDYLTRPIPIRWPISAALVAVSVFAFAASTTYFLRSVPDGEARDPWARGKTTSRLKVCRSSWVTNTMGSHETDAEAKRWSLIAFA